MVCPEEVWGGCLCRFFLMCLTGPSMEPMRCAASRPTCGSMSRGEEVSSLG